MNQKMLKMPKSLHQSTRIKADKINRGKLYCAFFKWILKLPDAKGCMIALAASIDFSPLWDLKCILKSAGQVDAKLHWLHLFDFSPLCVFKCILKLPA